MSGFFSAGNEAKITVVAANILDWLKKSRGGRGNWRFVMKRLPKLFDDYGKRIVTEPPSEKAYRVPEFYHQICMYCPISIGTIL